MPQPPAPVRVGPYECGPQRPLLLIAGPCVLETEELALSIARHLQGVAQRLGVWVPLDEVERLREPATMSLDEVDALLARCANVR